MAYTDVDNGELYFQTKLYSGTGSSQSITFDGSENMQPDWLWIKRRDSTANHRTNDVVRGVTKGMNPNQHNGEDTLTDSVTSFDSNGFSLGAGSQGYTNTSGGTFVAWCWKAGGSASSNSDGSITSSVSANTTSGFSIVTTTGTGSNATIGHGLGAAPSMIIGKRRDSGSTNWRIYNKNLSSNSHIIFLDTSGPEQSGNSSTWNNTTPTSSVFSVGTSGDTNASSGTFVFYCFAEKKGFSKFGSYTGNGNADGRFVFTGFEPAFVLIKRTDSSTSWQLIDNKRSDVNGSNIIDKILASNSSDAEYDEGSANWFADFVSNGFKLRNSLGASNTSGASHIYMAFAENPFVNSKGIPTTAR